MSLQIDAHWIALFSGIAITSLSQILFRSGAQSKSTWMSSFINLRVVLGYVLFFLVTVLNLYALQSISFNTLTAWASLTFIATPLLATCILKEKITGHTMFGGGLIVLGVTFFTFASFY